MSRQLTMQQWNDLGYRVREGEKAVGWQFNRALFTKDQVVKVADHYSEDFYGGNYYDQGDNYTFGHGGNPDQMDYDLGLCGQS